MPEQTCIFLQKRVFLDSALRLIEKYSFLPSKIIRNLNSKNSNLKEFLLQNIKRRSRVRMCLQGAFRGSELWESQKHLFIRVPMWIQWSMRASRELNRVLAQHTSVQVIRTFKNFFLAKSLFLQIFDHIPAPPCHASMMKNKLNITIALHLAHVT